MEDRHQLKEIKMKLHDQISALSNKLTVLSDNIFELQNEVEYFESKCFGKDKIKDDNDAMQFYTGFQNYGVFMRQPFSVVRGI